MGHSRDPGSPVRVGGQPAGDLEALLTTSNEPDATATHRAGLLDARDAPVSEATISPADLEASLDEHHAEAPSPAATSRSMVR